MAQNEGFIKNMLKLTPESNPEGYKYVKDRMWQLPHLQHRKEERIQKGVAAAPKFVKFHRFYNFFWKKTPFWSRARASTKRIPTGTLKGFLIGEKHQR